MIGGRHILDWKSDLAVLHRHFEREITDCIGIDAISRSRVTT